MISIDNRIGSKEFEPLIESKCEVFDFEQKGIPGDVFFSGNGVNGPILVGIEIKSLSDLVSSINSGRLQGTGKGSNEGQILRMLKYFDISVLVYYGRYYADKDSIITLRSSREPLRLGNRSAYWCGMHNALFELSMLGVKVQRVNTRKEVAMFIDGLRKFFQKPWKNHKLLRTFNESSARLARVPSVPHKVLVAAKMLTAIDGVGYDRAVAVATHFSGDILAMIGSIATNSDMIANIKVGGRRIGGVISKKMKEAIGEQYL